MFGDKFKCILKIVVVVCGAISGFATFLLNSGCSGMQFDCQGSYCVKKV